MAGSGHQECQGTSTSRKGMGQDAHSSGSKAQKGKTDSGRQRQAAQA